MSAGFHYGRDVDHGAADLATRLRLHRSRGEWRGPCPTCGYPEAFVMSVGQGGRLLGWCANCQNKTAVAQLLAEMQGGAATPKQVERDDAAARAAKEARAFERALALWNGSEPVGGTIAERYLAARGLPHLATSAALKFRGDCPHPSRSRLPAMIALVQGADGGPVGIHRTYLRRDGSAKADIEPRRAALGPVRGAAVRLDSVAAEIVVGEGIESSGSAGLLLGLPAWSAVSAGNIALALVLPPQVRSVVIAADPDESGRQAANAAWHRWSAAGIRCRIATPKSDGDCNDILMRRLAREETT
jgi:putative DNA primase/helicase